MEREFARNRDIYGARMRCGPGCSDCCGQLFQITEIEASWISHGVALLDASKREMLQARAAVYLQDRRALISRQGEPEAWGSLPPPGSRLPCPALIDGVCSIYEHRPLICRKFGMPLYNPMKPGRVFACELNFRDGDEIDDNGLVQIHTGIHNDWMNVQAAYNAQGLRRDADPVTVARAILEDFSDCGSA